MGIVNKKTQFILNLIMTILALACILPFVLLIMASLTDEVVLTTQGYSFFPSKFSLDAYQYLLSAAGRILRAYGMTIFVRCCVLAKGRYFVPSPSG